MCPPPPGQNPAIEQTSGASTTHFVDSTVEGRIPTDKISQSGFAYVKKHLHPLILAHSLRVYLYAKSLDQREGGAWASPDRQPLLFIAALFHDVGTTAVHDGEQRFEVEGADAAATHLRQNNVSKSDIHEVWVAIALHTSPQIAERISPLARLIRIAVKIDFEDPIARKFADEGEIEKAEGWLVRGEIEKVLGDAVAEQALKRPNPQSKAPSSSWPNNLVKSALENPGWEGVNKGF